MKSEGKPFPATWYQALYWRWYWRVWRFRGVLTHRPILTESAIVWQRRKMEELANEHLKELRLCQRYFEQEASTQREPLPRPPSTS